MDAMRLKCDNTGDQSMQSKDDQPKKVVERGASPTHQEVIMVVRQTQVAQGRERAHRHTVLKHHCRDTDMRAQHLR